MKAIILDVAGAVVGGILLALTINVRWKLGLSAMEFATMTVAFAAPISAALRWTELQAEIWLALSRWRKRGGK